MKLGEKFFSIFRRDVLLLCATLVTGIVVARVLGPEALGIWTILLIIPGYLEAIGRLQVDAAAVYFIGREPEITGQIALLVQVVALLASLLMGLIFFFGFNYFYNFLFSGVEQNFEGHAKAIFLLFPLRLMFLNYTYLLIALDEIALYNRIVVLQALSVSALTILCITVFSMGVEGALIGNLAGVTAAVIYAAVSTTKAFSYSLGWDFSLVRRIAGYAFKLYLSGLIGYLQNNVTSLIAAVTIQPAQLAFYATAKALSEVSTRNIPIAVNTILFPHLSRLNESRDAAELTARLFRINLIILCTLSVLLNIVIEVLVVTLYGQDYISVVKPFYIIIWSVVGVQSALVFGTYFSSQGRADLLPKASIAPLILQILLTVLLTPKMGFVGAALSFSISSASLAMIRIALFLQMARLDLNVLVPGREDLKAILTFVYARLAWR